MRLACIATLLVTPAAAETWSGFYAGVHTGYADLAHDVARDENASPVFYAYEQSADAALAGGQVGYRHQSGRFVFGIEADAAAADFRQTIGPIYGDGATVDYAVFEADWIASVRLSAAYALDGGVLIYATGGAGFSEWTERAAQSGGDPDQLTSRRTGWTAGVGLAVDLGGDWFGAAEYLRYDFGRVRRDGPLSGDVTSADTRIDTLKLALNFRF